MSVATPELLPESTFSPRLPLSPIGGPRPAAFTWQLPVSPRRPPTALRPDRRWSPVPPPASAPSRAAPVPVAERRHASLMACSPFLSFPQLAVGWGGASGRPAVCTSRKGCWGLWQGEAGAALDVTAGPGGEVESGIPRGSRRGGPGSGSSLAPPLSVGSVLQACPGWGRNRQAFHSVISPSFTKSSPA